jgi:hypothetical protein
VSAGIYDPPEEDMCETDGTKSFSLKEIVLPGKLFGTFVVKPDSGYTEAQSSVPPAA